MDVTSTVSDTGGHPPTPTPDDSSSKKRVSLSLPSYEDKLCAPAALSQNAMYERPCSSPISVSSRDKDVSELPFHLCNQLDVQQSTCKALKDMFATNWPSPTSHAIKQDQGFCKIYNLVKAKNLPNALGARVLIPSALNIRAWINNLSEYHDNQICHFLAFGWPIGYYSLNIPTSVQVNHPSATAHPAHVDSFLQAEKQHNAIAGPFDTLPFHPWTHGLCLPCPRLDRLC